MSRNIVFEGWLTKSPPTKRIWRTKWRRRWFALRQSGELPGQYFLDYYADRNCRRLKGTINLDLCEQVDAGLHMERGNNVTQDPKLRGSVFTIQTQSRTYHLEADCEADMVKWVDAICCVCGLQPKDNSSNDLDTYENGSQMSTINEKYQKADTTGPYIPISECITGVRAQNSQKAFTFDTNNIVISTRRTPVKVPSKSNQMYLSQPHIRFNNAEFSENDSNLSDEDCKSLNASQSNIRDWAVSKTYTKSIPHANKYREYQHGPPVPPRPPKTLAMSKGIYQRDSFRDFRADDRSVAQEEVPNPNVKVPGTILRTIAQPSHGPAQVVPNIKITDEDEERLNHAAMQYSNLVVAPPTVVDRAPAVDRALKPRHSSHSIGNVNNLGIQLRKVMHFNNEEVRSNVLQYLDLDLHTSKPTTAKDMQRKSIEVVHGKSLSAVDAASAYKTVDFLKTEAFNITRQDAEASRNSHH